MATTANIDKIYGFNPKEIPDEATPLYATGKAMGDQGGLYLIAAQLADQNRRRKLEEEAANSDAQKVAAYQQFMQDQQNKDAMNAAIKLKGNAPMAGVVEQYNLPIDPGAQGEWDAAQLHKTQSQGTVNDARAKKMQQPGQGQGATTTVESYDENGNKVKHKMSMAEYRANEKAINQALARGEIK